MIRNKKKALSAYVLSACLAGLVLSGCTSTQSGNLNQQSQAQGRGQAGSAVTTQDQGGITLQEVGPDASASAGTVSSASGNTTVSSADGQTTGGQASSGTAQSGQANAEGNQSQIVPYDSADQTGGPPAGDSASQAKQDRDLLTGNFRKGDGSEAVTLSLDTDTALSFSFEVCGIHGTASVAGNTATYQGDDDYSITFSVSDDQLTVSVGGDDAASSPINGLYVRTSGSETDSLDQDS